MFKRSTSIYNQTNSYIKDILNCYSVSKETFCQIKIKSHLNKYLIVQNKIFHNSFTKWKHYSMAYSFSINNKKKQEQFMSSKNSKSNNQQNYDQQNKKKSEQPQENEKYQNSNDNKKQNSPTSQVFPNMNYYQILGFQKNYVNPTEEEVKAAYLDAVKKYHPDLSIDKQAVEKFQIIQKVYEVLSDPQKRSQYRAGLKISVQEGKVYDAAKRFKQEFKDYDKVIKQKIPDQWQFSYKLYKEHYEKIQTAKKNYTKYHGQDKQYWVANDQISIRPKAVIQAVSMIAGSLIIGSCALYFIWK